MLALAWKATLLLGAAHGIAYLLNKRSAAERHLMWVLVMICLMGLPWLDRAAPKVLTIEAGGEAAVMASEAPANAAVAGTAGRDWTAFIWWAGAGGVLGYHLLGMVLLRRRFRSSRRLECRVPEIGLRRKVEVRMDEACQVPMTWGLFRPVILLPAAALEWAEERLHMVLLHELLHVKRFDFVTQCLAQAVCALYWWNPLAWVAQRLMRKEREHACDDGVIRLGASGPHYAGHLLEVARGTATSAAVCMASHLEGRIRSALDPRVARHAATAGSAAVLLGVLVLVLAPLAGIRISAQGSAGSVQGSVLDQTGAVIPGSSVVVISADGSKKEITRSEADGRYVFPTLAPGTYTLEVRQPGFALYRKVGLEVTAGHTTELNAALSMGQVHESLEIVGKKPTTLGAAPMQAGGPKRIRVGGNVQATKILRMPKPQYPSHLQAQGIEGTVLLEGVIDVDGSVVSLRSLNSLVHPELTKAAVEAVENWKYQPTLLNGQPVQVITTITVNFRLAP